MKKLLWFVLLLSSLTPGLAMAQSVFDGTWKVDLKTAQFPTKPDVYLLQDGMYHCNTCVPAIGIRADGQDQKVTGHPYFDTVSIKLVDDRTIEEIDKKNGKTVTTSKSWVSPDGKTIYYAPRARTDGNNLAFHRFFLGGIGDDDPAFGLFLLVHALDHHAIVQRSEFHRELLRPDCLELFSSRKKMREIQVLPRGAT